MRSFLSKTTLSEKSDDIFHTIDRKKILKVTLSIGHAPL